MSPDLIRCAAEIAEIEMRPDVCAGTAPAWLVALGENDWVVEADLIAKGTVQPLMEVFRAE